MAEPDLAPALGAPRFRTMRAFRYYFASGDCDHSRVAEVFRALKIQVSESVTGSRSALGSTVIARHLDADAVSGTTWTLQVGHPVIGDATARPGTADMQELGPLPCVAMVYEGPVTQAEEAASLLRRTIQEAGLGVGHEYREHHLNWEGPESPNNVLLLQMEVTGPGGDTSHLPETPEAVYGPVRVHTVGAYRLLYTSAQTDRPGVEAAFVPLIDQLSAARHSGDVFAVGCMRFSLREADTLGMVVSEVGVPVAAGTEAPAGAKVRDVAPVRVASIACAGPYASLTEAAGLLSAGIADRGLTATGEYEEWYLHYEGDSSPNTITWVLNPLR